MVSEKKRKFDTVFINLRRYLHLAKGTWWNLKYLLYLSQVIKKNSHTMLNKVLTLPQFKIGTKM